MDDLIARIFPKLSIRPLTRQLVTRLLLDLPMTTPLVADFGIESDDHYRALRTAVWHGADDIEAMDEDDDEGRATLSRLHHRILTLDAAYGNGERLNAFVRQHAPEYAECVRFETVWDGLLENDPT